MKKMTYFVTLCLFSATAFAVNNNPKKETEIAGLNTQMAREVRANPKQASVIQNSTLRARLDKVNAKSGHLYVTSVGKVGGRAPNGPKEPGKPDYTPLNEYTVHAVWVKN